ncbi:MAG TPA: hypothetical protein VH744_01790, partial [Terriglobales bacterium]
TPPVLNSLACTPTTLNPGGTGTCTVALTKKAVTPFIVTVVSSSTALKVPASVTVPGGASSVTFTTTASTTSTTIRTYGIIVTAGGVSQAVYIVIAPISTASDTGAPQPAALTCGPNPLSFPAALVCRVEIDPAPANPVAMTLSSDSDKLELPDPIIVRPGITHVPFIAFSKENAGAETILITASIGDANVSTGVILAESLEPAPAEPGQAETNGAPGSPRITSVVNAATLSPEAACSPGSIAVVLGSGLASSSPDAARSVRVRINGEDTPVLAASPTRVSFLCPAWAPGTDMSIVVENELGSSDTVPASMHSVSPGILTLDNTGKGQGLIMLAGTKELAAIASPVVHGSPVRPGELVSIFATGLGASEGTSVLVLLDSVPAEVTYLGLIPDRPGLYRIDAKVPRAVARADRVPVQLRIPLIDGRWAESNQVTMSIDGPPVNDE